MWLRWTVSARLRSSLRHTTERRWTRRRSIARVPTATPVPSVRHSWQRLHGWNRWRPRMPRSRWWSGSSTSPGHKRTQRTRRLSSRAHSRRATAPVQHRSGRLLPSWWQPRMIAFVSAAAVVILGVVVSLALIGQAGLPGGYDGPSPSPERSTIDATAEDSGGADAGESGTGAAEAPTKSAPTTPRRHRLRRLGRYGVRPHRGAP